MNHYNELKRKTFTDTEKQTITAFFSTYLKYIKSVEEDIFLGNEIRNDKFADIQERQDVIKSLDSKRRSAHDQYLRTVDDFAKLYTKKTGIFLPSDFFRNRATMADLGAMICYNINNINPQTKSPDGALRDQLANNVHKEVITIDDLKSKINNDFDIKID